MCYCTVLSNASVMELDVTRVEQKQVPCLATRVTEQTEKRATKMIVLPQLYSISQDLWSCGLWISVPGLELMGTLDERRSGYRHSFARGSPVTSPKWEIVGEVGKERGETAFQSTSFDLDIDYCIWAHSFSLYFYPILNLWVAQKPSLAL